MPQNKTICIVDDQDVIVEMYRIKLEQAGYRVVAAEDGEQGYDVIKKIKPDLALIDIVMPKMDGLTLVRKLKKDKELKHIPIIILSNYISPEENEEALRLGALFSLAKPHFLPSQILEIIDEVLEERE